MSARNLASLFAIIAAVVVLAFVPSVTNGYQLSLAINIMSYTVLATAWTLFSGPTRYVSLATVAFFGIGAYTVAVLGEEQMIVHHEPGTTRDYASEYISIEDIPFEIVDTAPSQVVCFRLGDSNLVRVSASLLTPTSKPKVLFTNPSLTRC